jgi:hypothetical protein
MIVGTDGNPISGGKRRGRRSDSPKKTKAIKRSRKKKSRKKKSNKRKSRKK